jgi:hypothetical protein
MIRRIRTRCESIDNLNTPVLTAVTNLSAILAGGGPNARIGFTAGAAGASENHDILSWSFTPNPNVTEVTFHQIAPDTQRTVPIDANPLRGEDHPASDYGDRIFPDHDLPLDDADRSTIRVDANIGTNLPNKMVYFRTFDMDDPSVYSEIDPDVVGNDNRGSVVGGSTAGRITIPSGMETVCEVRSMSVACPTASDGIASVNFTVTKQPGDNFAIAASTNEAEINAVNFDLTDGLHLLSGAGTRLNTTCGAGEKVCRSRLLTVWRRLHIETDRMPTIDVNHLDVKLLPVPPPGPPGIKISPGETRELDVYDPVHSSLEEGRFVAGRAHVGNSWMSVQNNTDYEITVTNTTLNAIFVPYNYTFQLYDDDDFNDNNGTSVIGDEGEPIPPPDHLFIEEYPNGDSIAHNVLALAYIRPVYDINNVGNGLSPLFKANIDGFTVGDQLDSIIAFENRMTEEDEQFWTVYLLNAYQGFSYEDGDGMTPGDGFAPPMDERPAVGFTTYNNLASFIFVEPAGSKECNSRPSTQLYSCDGAAITAREVAIALGAKEEDGGLLNLDNTVLSAQSLDKIRNKLYP